jgi:nitrate/TMAO reductase-like tetraheme cytochrome c subunit
MSGCHAGQGWETDNSMGPNCISCHYDGFPAHGLNGHVAHAAIDKTKSSACVACHGSDYLNVATKTGTTYTVPAGAYPPAAGSSQEHAGCSCHSYNEAGPGKSCVDCHAAQYAPHGFNNTTATASGHNTTAYNGFGAKTKFDGSQGTTITWTVTAAGTASVTPAAGASGSWLATSGPTASGVTTTTWAFPTQSVFWNTQSNGLGGTATDDIAPAGAISGLSSSSIITCQDCHTGLNAAGPHGAAQNWGIDPNYPGDYGYAELTKYVTCNTQYTSATLPGQSLDTTPAHFAIFLTKADAIAKTNGYAATDPAAASSPYFTPLSISGIDVRSTLATAGLLINRTDGTTGASAVICAKCHDLENFNYASWAVEGANTAHDSHHQDQTNGSSQCVSCHVGLPHGWTRPRLLVNTATDVAPYLSPDELGTSASATTSTLGGGSAGMLSLSAINNHPLGGSVQEPYSTGNGASSTTTYTAFDGNGNVVSPAAGVTYNPGHVGYAYWNEGQCAACNDHNSSSNLDKSTGPRIR